jgi:carboxyl-terminal processing protease
LDYSHRREDGSVGSIPDSIKRSFKTTAGRIVYDGGGIDPDIKTEQREAHPLTQKLYQAGFIFDYATLYAYQHPTITDARSFSLTNDEYVQFINWMKTKNYTYTSPLDQQLKNLNEEAKLEKNYAELKPQLDLLYSKIEESKKNELHLYKDQIKMLLEEDITSRYYLAKGSVEVSFKYDQEIKKASEVLLNPAHYKKILNHP